MYAELTLSISPLNISWLVYNTVSIPGFNANSSYKNGNKFAKS